MSDALIQGGMSLLAAFLTIGHGILIWQFTQFSKRLSAVENRNETQDVATRSEIRKLEANLMACKLEHSARRNECAQTFVQRDDWIRFSCQIDKKLDALYARMGEVRDGR